MSEPANGPCHGLQVVELARGVSELGLGMAGGVPGMILADLGASVVRIVDPQPIGLDRDVAWGRAWHRDKQLVRTDDRARIKALLASADVVLASGCEARVEQEGVGRGSASGVYARCRPSRTARGTVADHSLLVEAEAGFCTQLQGHREGPIFVDARSASAGTAFLLTSGVLALLRRRALTGVGGWMETSLYDGMLATLGTMIGRSERAPEHVESYWAKGSTFPNFMYRCADGELLQIWFGGKGMYMKLIGVLGDEQASEGYYADQVSGALQARALRWRSRFAEQPRAYWMERLRAAGVACEPVLAPGDVLSDPHLKAIGLAIERDRDTLVASPIAVEPGQTAGGDASYSPGSLLSGVRVLDFSAFVAGPLGAQVLADLGADVIKVEPPEGEAMRAATYALAACHRGKRSLAIDITSPDARPVVERLIRWADVVLHNFRVGVSTRLGIDEATVARLNPRAVYCHASAFGTSGPRALFPGNDALMQALTGFEHALGGPGNEPLAATWIPIDMAGGWLSALGMLAGLYAGAAGRGQRVTTSLLGAGMLLQSGVYQHEGRVVRQPELDREQTGYGPGYRLYRCADAWLAVVIPDAESWQRLAREPECAALALDYTPLRRGADDHAARNAESILQTAFASATAASWRERLHALGAHAELSEAIDRDQFRRRILDDALNQQLGRVIAYEALSWGRFEQLGILLRCGPDASGATPRNLPEIGEHSRAVLQELGVEAAVIDSLVRAKVVHQPA
ncbi:MAG: CoA transferase [Polyangiales bacterium]